MSICAQEFLVSFRARTRPLYVPTTTRMARKMNPTTRPTTTSRAGPISVSLLGWGRLELSQELGDAAFLAGGDQGFDLITVEPVAVPAGASVDFHSQDRHYLHLCGAADAPPVARLRIRGPRKGGLEGILRAAAEPRELVELAAVQPRAVAAQAAVDLDAVELENDQGFLAGGAHGARPP